MRRWLAIALGGLVLSCQGPAAVLAREGRAVSQTGGQAATGIETHACMPWQSRLPDLRRSLKAHREDPEFAGARSAFHSQRNAAGGHGANCGLAEACAAVTLAFDLALPRSSIRAEHAAHNGVARANSRSDRLHRILGNRPANPEFARVPS